jgi:hypothetical protein
MEALKLLISLPLNVFPLSEMINEGIPRLAMNRSKLLTNASLDMSGTKSRCSALLHEQVYKDM